jgi:hypothetical protein
MIHQYDINNAKAIHNFLEFLVEEEALDGPEERFGLIEYVVNLG